MDVKVVAELLRWMAYHQNGINDDQMEALLAARDAVLDYETAKPALILAENHKDHDEQLALALAAHWTWVAARDANRLGGNGDGGWR
jgi:hypothetical protein